MKVPYNNITIEGPNSYSAEDRVARNAVTTTTTAPPRWDIYNTNNDKWFEEVDENGIHFSRIGTLATELDFIHLIYDIDLNDLMVKRTNICGDNILEKIEQINHLTDKAVYDLLLDEYNHRCQSINTQVDDIYNLFMTGSHSYMYHAYPRSRYVPFHSQLRRKRQLVILGAFLLGMGIAAIGTYLFDHATLAQVSINSGTNPATIKVLQKHETRLNLDERNINDLKTAVETILKAESQLEAEIIQMQLFHKIENILTGFQEEVLLLSMGLSQLRDGRMSSYLVKPLQMQKTIRTFRHVLKAQELHTILANINEVYSCETSHIMFQNGTLRAITHIPIFKPQSTMGVYHWKEVPMTIHHHMFSFQPENEVLAISTDKTLFRPMSMDKYQQCNEFHNITYCVHNNYYLKEHHPSCIKSLFVANEGEILDQCPLKIRDPADHLIHLNHKDVIIYQRNKNLVTYECDRGYPKEAQTYYKGLKLFHIYPSCTLNTKHFKVHGSKNLYATPVQIYKVYPNLNSLKQFSDLQFHLNNTLASSVLQDIKGQEALRVNDINALFEKYSSSWTIAFSALGVIGGIIIIIICCICYKKCCGPCISFCSDSLQQFRSVLQPTPPVPPPIDRLEMTRMSRRNPARTSNILYQ